MGQRIALIGAVALAVGQILEDRRNRILLSVLRQPDAGSQSRAVPQRDQRMLDLAHGAGKVADDQERNPLRRDEIIIFEYDPFRMEPLAQIAFGFNTLSSSSSSPYSRLPPWARVGRQLGYISVFRQWSNHSRMGQPGNGLLN